jgi:TonB family protein
MKGKRDRRQDRTIFWFLLVSLIVHHALVITVVRAPDLDRYETVEVDYVAGHEEAGPPEPDEAEVPVVTPEDRVAEAPAEPVEEASKQPEKEKPRPEEPEPPEPPKKTQEPEEVIALVPVEGLHFVDIDSHESDEPPPDAKYFAPINSQVDEETRAENTNLDEDEGQSSPDEEPGNAPDSLAAHLDEDENQPAKDSPETVRPEQPDIIDATPAPSSSQVEKQTGKVAEKSHEAEAVVLPTLTPDHSPPVSIAKSDDGEILDLETGKQVPTFKEAKKAKEKKGGPEAGSDARLADVDLSWTDIDGVLGAEMDQMKQAWKEAKKSKKKGGFTKDIDKVMGQLENYNPDVKPGNQTALNAAYHPYAEYITAFHRTLHPQWGDGFLASLMTKPNGDPLNDMSLWVKLEFVVLSDGSIEKVTVVRSSGNLVYDVAAIDALYGGQPYPPPPDIIKSYDGKVYMRWGMYRNQSQCGVWNAEPYILAAPKDKKKVKPPEEKKAPEE